MDSSGLRYGRSLRPPLEREGGIRHVHQPDAAPKKSNAYEMFILVLTILSLVVMVALLLPLNDATIRLLTVYDNMICVVFLGDFAMNMARSSPKRNYFIGRRGWLDLLGSIPALGVFKFTALLRLARLSRLARITRLLRGENKKALVQDVVTHRGQYAAFITVLAAFIVLIVSSVFVLQFESTSPEREHQDGRRRVVVGRGHDHHCRVRRRVPGDDARPDHRRAGHVRRRGDHRSTREHPGEHPRASAADPAGTRRRCVRRSLAAGRARRDQERIGGVALCRWLRAAPIHLRRSH